MIIDDHYVNPDSTLGRSAVDDRLQQSIISQKYS